MRRPLLALFSTFLAFFSAAVNLAHSEKTPFNLAQLKTPPGFHISVFAEQVDGPRMMIFSPGRVLLVSESGEGKVVALPDSNIQAKRSAR